MKRGYPNTSGTGMKFDFSSPLCLVAMPTCVWFSRETVKREIDKLESMRKEKDVRDVIDLKDCLV